MLTPRQEAGKKWREKNEPYAACLTSTGLREKEIQRGKVNTGEPSMSRRKGLRACGEYYRSKQQRHSQKGVSLHLLLEV